MHHKISSSFSNSFLASPICLLTPRIVLLNSQVVLLTKYRSFDPQSIYVGVDHMVLLTPKMNLFRLSVSFFYPQSGFVRLFDGLVDPKVVLLHSTMV